MTVERSVRGSSAKDADKSSSKTSGHHVHRYDVVKNGKIANTTNPFIIFFLRLRSKNPKEPVTLIARVAGKKWTKMSSDQKQKYINLANAEKKRREDKKRRRRVKIT
ncbi:FACT complex subunit SSRP1 isoform X2 [Fopius arisanus]|uniref:FACT complex subunit SSRP1 isoform X2 n=1 Tax=Fopius arisanus TaxID=64838 RepID=A0A9R1TPZ8_9HYME|nr:PREDICTED: FACT complex subunit SSRP1-like isoform X2 [Fopius arisanus]